MYKRKKKTTDDTATSATAGDLSKRTRGITRMLQYMQQTPQVTDADHIFFDDLGIPHGDRAPLISVLGTLARSKAKVYSPN